MPRCLISFGSNLGNSQQLIEEAAVHLRQELVGNRDASGVVIEAAENRFRLSRFYNTPPVGGPTGQPPFVNAVAAVETMLSAWDVWHAIRQVEHLLGRERNERWEARRIDLDILLYGDVRIWTPMLKIPHPRMCMRRFILEPAVEVASDARDPVSGCTIEQLARRLRGRPASLLICTAGEKFSRSLVAEVSRQAMAEWLPADSPAPASVGRWLRTANMERLAPIHWRSILAANSAAQAVLLVRGRGELGSQWEDAYHEAAECLGLMSAEPARSDREQSDKRAQGASYLLPCDDLPWAIHELVSAFDAMDCPIEALPTHW